MRRASPVDAMLLGTVLLWALNVSLTKYMFEHGWSPLAYGTIRYFAAISLFWVFTYRRERSFWVARRDLRSSSSRRRRSSSTRSASSTALKFATRRRSPFCSVRRPCSSGVFSTPRPRASRPSFWIGRGHLRRDRVDRHGIGGGFSSDFGMLHLDRHRFTWAVLHALDRAADATVLAVPHQLARARDRLGAAGARSASRRSCTSALSFGWTVWLAFGYAVVGPLFLTNILWFTAIDRVGPSRASLFANLQPFFAVFFALILLSESLHVLEIAGGLLIFIGIVLERFWRRPALVQRAGGGLSRDTLRRERPTIPTHGRRLHAAARLGPRRVPRRQREAGGVLLRARVRVSHAPPTQARRPASATARRTCSSRATSASSSPARCARTSEIDEHHARHGDGVKDIALHGARCDGGVPAGGAAGRARRRRAEAASRTSSERSSSRAIATYGDTVAHLRRSTRLRGCHSCRATSRVGERRGERRRRPARTSTTSSATSSSGA